MRSKDNRSDHDVLICIEQKVMALQTDMVNVKTVCSEFTKESLVDGGRIDNLETQVDDHKKVHDRLNYFLIITTSGLIITVAGFILSIAVG